MCSNKTTKVARFGVVLMGLAALAACDQRAGAELENVTFGESVALNAVTQISSGDGGAQLINLSNRFNTEVPTTVTFDFNRSTLTPEARSVLIQQADWLRANPRVRLRVAGHTDAVGGEAFNNRLGLRRARAVVAFLVERGIDGDRLDAVDTFGESQLAVQTADRERRNRRAVTSVAGFVNAFGEGEFDGRRAQEVYRAYRTGEAGISTGGGGETSATE
ncbi:MAG: OmpA family protein [Pseudomonadota bacterium]